MEFKLIVKKLNNTLTTEEEIIFNKWFEESQIHKNYFNSVKNNYLTDLDNINVEEGWFSIRNKLSKHSQKKTYWKYAVAASVALLISINFIFNKKEEIKIGAPIIVENDTKIEIGTDKATLTLGDGSVVSLEKGSAYNGHNVTSNGEEIVYNKKKSNSKDEIAYNTLTVPRGGQFYLVLSDGTKVWLNSESKLIYPVNFVDGMLRKVELVYGEAYFDVSPSIEHKDTKFLVFNDHQEVEVLGTEFNIKAYNNEDSIYTTLVEGKVSVSNMESKQKLIPNQQTKLNLKNKSIGVQEVDVYSEISWKKGLFSFKGKTLKEIMVVLTRWYDFEVEFANEELENVKFNGVLSKKDSIKEILNVIKKTKFINAYEIKNQKITIQ
ncbi:FecR family protein [Cellulophaga sp. F20128]|uniref:FecR family protein n=1 Tax=Cellulophaga sp. F20128 TaxID=2926413 RepID=UPI001FF35542|nr:FecR family protein [Cellulophaga sp. F20128]